jgi:hypothetical protein
MLAWNVDPWALTVPFAQAGAAPPADEAGALADVVAAGVLATEDELLVLAVPLLLVPHAATANSPPAVSTAATVREVLTGNSSCVGRPVLWGRSSSKLGGQGGRVRAHG